MQDSFRRQFVLTDSERQWPTGWNTVHLQRYNVHHHPDLPVTQARTGEETLTLLGYAVDPKEPNLNDAQLLHRLINRYPKPDLLIEDASQLGGRWVLVAELKEQDIVMHDACGLRQVFYSDDSSDVLFCASQASTAARFYELEIDKDAECDFLQTPFVQSNREYWWPGDSTRYRGVHCLLPNHYLELRTRRSQRYSTKRPGMPHQLSCVVDITTQLLKNLIDGAAYRYKLALPLTAGWDSRTILAACRAAEVVPFCYTLRFAAMMPTCQDLAIPQRMLQSIGWTHHVIECPDSATSEFAAIYKESVDPAHDEACAIAMGLQSDYPDGYVSLSGHCSEIARCFYHHSPQEGLVRPKDLANLAGMGHTPFVLGKFEEWLRGADKAATQLGLSLLDLFYWEQRAGRWAANGQSQWDIVHERFTPFNCRSLLLTLLAADPSFRRPPEYVLYREMIRSLCPELLSYSINPETTAKLARN